MLTLGVWILVAWFVGIPLALWALYGVAVVCRSILDAIEEICGALLMPFTAEGRAQMREAAKAARDATAAAKAQRSSPSDMRLAWALGLGPWVFLVGSFAWVAVGSALGFYHPS